jgi:hypothetical protein
MKDHRITALELTKPPNASIRRKGRSRIRRSLAEAEELPARQGKVQDAQEEKIP